MLATGILLSVTIFLLRSSFSPGDGASVLAFCGDVDRWAVYPPTYRETLDFQKQKTTNNKEKSVPP